MSELKRKRDARDLWFSRGQVNAAAVAAGLLAVIGFAGGVYVGRGQASPSLPSELAKMSEGDLLELIARVESTAQVGGALERLTFPDALSGGLVPSMPPETSPAVAGGFTVTAPLGGDVLPDMLPDGVQTGEVVHFSDAGAALAVRDGLRAVSGLRAWLGKDIVDGAATYVVLVELPPEPAR